MATIQERLDRMKLDGVQQRLDRMKQDGARANALQQEQSAASLPGVAGTGVEPRSAPSGGGLTKRFIVTPLHTPSFEPRSVQAVQEEIDGLDGTIRELRQQQRTWSAQASQLDEQAANDVLADTAALTSRAQAARYQVEELDKQIAQMESHRAGLDWELNWADQHQFEKLRKTPEFQAAVDKAMGAPFGMSVDSRKPVYRDVRNAMTYFQAKAIGDEGMAQASKNAADMALDRMSESQRERLAWYVGTGDYDGAADYLNKIAPMLNQAQAADLEQKLSEWSQEHPVLGTGVNVVSWPMNIPAYIANAKQAAKNAFTGKNEMDPHGSAYGMTKIGTGTSQGVSEAARSAATQAFGSEKAGDAAAFLASTGLSIGQNATQIAALGPYSLAGMAMSAAGSETTGALDRGATPGQAFALGTASGTIEALTEKLPLDNLFRLAKEGGGKGVKAAALDILKQMGSEASEEAISEIAGNIADAAVMGDQSELNAYIRQLQAAGMSREDAERAAAWQFYVVNTGLAALGGGISGGVMGGGALALNRMGGKGAQKAATEGVQEGVTLPRGDEGTVTLPRVEDAVQAVQKGLETAQDTQTAPQEAHGGTDGDLAEQIALVERGLRESYERGEINEAGYQGALAKVRKAQTALESAQNALEAQGQGAAPAAPEGVVQRAQESRRAAEEQNSAGGPEVADHGPQLQEIAAQAQELREDYAQGRIGDEEFDQGMDSLQAEAELLGLEASQAADLVDGTYMIKGGADNGAGTAGTGEQLPGGDGGRLSGAGARGETASLGEGGPQSPADAGGAEVQGTAGGQLLRGEAVSSKELGLVNGTDAKTVRVLPENSWDDGLRDLAQRVRRETGLNVRFTLGPMEMVRSDGQLQRVRGVYNEKGIFVQADDGTATAKQIAAHEIFHSYTQSDQGLIQAAEEAVTERFGPEELDQMADQYIMALRGIVDVSELDEMDGAEYAQALATAKTEILADAFAGINAFGTEASKYQDTVQETLEERGTAGAQGRENAQAMDQRTGPPDTYSIDYDQDNRPFVTVEEDILDGVPRTEWTTKVKEILAERFPDGVRVGKNTIKINSQSRGEMTFSEYTRRLRSEDGSAYADKFRAAANADEIILASRDYINEGLKHSRKDNIRDFARGTVQLRVGSSDYTADVVVGTTSGGEMLLYDIVNLQRTAIQDNKKSGAEFTAQPHEARRAVDSSTPTQSAAPASDNVSIAQRGPAVKPWDGTLPRGTEGELTLPGGQERYSARDEVPDGLTLPTLAEFQARRAREGQDGAAQSTPPIQVPTTPQEAAELYRRKKNAQRVYQRAEARNRLTDHDKIQVGRLLRGELELSHLDPAKDNIKGITAVYEVKQEYEELARTIRQWNGKRKAELRAEADGFLESANQWKDKKAGILYSRETMERNIRDIVPDRELADRINKRYFQPVHQSAAEANRTKNQYRDRVRGLKLSRKKAAGNAVSEAHAVQMLGEAEDNIRWIQEGQGRRTQRDGKTLQEWQAVIGELWENNPNLDQNKIRGAVKEFRAIYDELFQQMNEARVRNGYEPVSYRQGYFPHFQADSEGLMAQFGRALGIDTAVTNLPTTINGLTHTFKPGIQWFGSALERKGFDTAYDAVQGFDRYIEGAADVIHQTDNIQALRALGAQARYRTGDEGLRQQVDRVNANTELTDQEKQALINDIHENGRFALSNFVVELDEYTNLLANKKSRADRNMEQAMGRRMYNIVKGLEGRVAANMVAVNPASWLTNFVPLTQGWGTVKTRFMLEGMWDTLKSYKADDGMVGMSSFLTNRRGSDPIVKTWAQSASAKLSQPMEYIDCFTADSLVRARFKQNQASGLSEAASIEEADVWAAGLMADRSKGSTPTLFNRSNPLTKVFTQFQLEVNNQLSYLFKDLPSDLKKKGLAALAAGLMKFLVGAYLYNEVYEYFIGRRCALDPIGILNDSVGDFTGYQIPNLVELGADAAQGNEISFETEKKKPFDAVTGLGKSVAEELPFIGGVLGGGRVPISSALPNWENLAKAAVNSEWSGEKRAATAAKELGNPLTYLALPFGGGQIKKIYQGLKAVQEGGSWTVDNEGQDVLQYPVFNETTQDKLLALPTALAFGKSALPTAREWAERGFKSMNAKQTACYQGMTELGVPQRDAYQLLQELGNVQKTDEASATDQKRKLLQEADISDQGKGMVYYTLLASDKERALMDGLDDPGEGARLLMELKGVEDSAAKKGLISGSSLSEEEKNAVFGHVLGKDSKGAAWSTKLTEAGLDEHSAAAVANAVNGLTPEKGKDTVSDAQKWRAAVDTARGEADQKAALLTIMSESARTRYEIADQYGIKPEAWVQVKEALPRFDENGNGSYSGKEIEKAIDALAGGGRMLAPWDKDPIRLSREEKAVLWQLFTGNKSGSGNPYSAKVGKKVAEELEKARTEVKREE